MRLEAEGLAWLRGLLPHGKGERRYGRSAGGRQRARQPDQGGPETPLPSWDFSLKALRSQSSKLY